MLNTFERTSKQHERRIARQRQMALMEEAATGRSLPSLLDGANSSQQQQPTSSIRSGVHAPPAGSTENARQFLWEDDGADNNDLPHRGIDWDRDNGAGGGSEKRSLVNLSPHRDSEMGGATGMSTVDIHEDGFDDERGGFDGDGSSRRVHGGICSRLVATCYTRRGRCLALVLVAGILAVVGIVVLLTAGGGGGDGGNVDDEPSNAPEDESGPTDAELFVRFEKIKDRILDDSVSHASSVENESSPQYKAIQWLTTHDEMALDVDDKFLAHRYALAVLWFAANDPNIPGIDDDDDDDDDGSELRTSGDSSGADRIDGNGGGNKNLDWVDSTNWLSGKGICLWYGIECVHKEGGSLLETTYDANNKITSLNLTANNIRGTIPKEIFNALGDLTALDFGNNEITGTIHSELGKLQNLENLYLASNYLSGSIPTEIGTLSKLSNLYLSDNVIEHKIPTEIGKLTELRGVGFFNNYLSGTVPSQIGNLDQLLALYLDINLLSGQIPTEIGKLASVVDIRLRRNKIEGTLPTELGNLNFIEILYLDSNSIGGSIPYQISNLDHLDELHLYKNELTGSLPKDMGVMNELVHIYLDSNQLTGEIPELWGGLADLEQLYLYNNQLTGTIPPTIEGMADLRNLRLQNNQIGGTIPSEMGKMFKLENLYMDNNKLSGPVPTQFGELTKLEKLHLHGNELTGTVPASVCKLVNSFFLEEFDADCGGDPKEIECECCSACYGV